VGALSVLTRQTNIIWVAFVVAVSIIRELKEVDILDPDENEQSTAPRSWLVFDPLAASAQFPGIFSISFGALAATDTVHCR
jgi:hypothetical protein